MAEVTYFVALTFVAADDGIAAFDGEYRLLSASEMLSFEPTVLVSTARRDLNRATA